MSQSSALSLFKDVAIAQPVSFFFLSLLGMYCSGFFPAEGRKSTIIAFAMTVFLVWPLTAAPQFMDKVNGVINTGFTLAGVGIHVLLTEIILSATLDTKGAFFWAVLENVYDTFIITVPFLAYHDVFPYKLFGFNIELFWILLLQGLGLGLEFYHGRAAAAALAPLVLLNADAPGIAAGRLKIRRSVLLTFIPHLLMFVGIIASYCYESGHLVIVRGTIIVSSILIILKTWFHKGGEFHRMVKGTLILVGVPIILDKTVKSLKQICAVDCKDGYNEKGFCKSGKPYDLATCPIDISGHFYLGVAMMVDFGETVSVLWNKDHTGNAPIMQRIKVGSFFLSFVYVLAIVLLLSKTTIARHSIFEKTAGAFLGGAIGRLISGDFGIAGWICLGFAAFFGPAQFVPMKFVNWVHQSISNTSAGAQFLKFIDSEFKPDVVLNTTLATNATSGSSPEGKSGDKPEDDEEEEPEVVEEPEPEPEFVDEPEPEPE